MKKKNGAMDASRLRFCRKIACFIIGLPSPVCLTNMSTTLFSI